MINKDASSASLLDLFLSSVREIFRLHNDRLLRQNSLAQYLVIAGTQHIDHRCFVLHLGVLFASLLRDKRPKFVEIDGRAVVVILSQVKVSHTNLAKVARMVLVKIDSMVVLPTGVTATSRMLPVLSDATMAVRNVSAKLSRLLLGCSH